MKKNKTIYIYEKETEIQHVNLRIVSDIHTRQAYNRTTCNHKMIRHSIADMFQGPCPFPQSLLFTLIYSLVYSLLYTHLFVSIYCFNCSNKWFTYFTRPVCAVSFVYLHSQISLSVHEVSAKEYVENSRALIHDWSCLSQSHQMPETL